MADAGSDEDVADAQPPPYLDLAALYVEDSERFPTILHRFVGYKQDSVLQSLVWKLCSVGEKTNLSYTYENEWRFHRHPLNNRGDISTALERQRSVEEIGIVFGLRGGPWLVPHERPGHFYALHWASLLRGAELAWEKDKLKENVAVQTSLNAGLQDCTIFNKNITSDVCRYLVDLGNIVNHETSSFTILQVFESTKQVEAGWQIKKTEMAWTVSRIGQGKMEQKKLSYANSIHRGRWRSALHYEKTFRFYEAACALMYPNGESLWDKLKSYCLSEVDFSHASMDVHNHVRLVTMFEMAWRKLKANHPDYMFIALALVLPRARGPKAVCVLLPGGIDRSQAPLLLETHVDNLLAKMHDGAGGAGASPAKVAPKSEGAPNTKKKRLSKLVMVDEEGPLMDNPDVLDEISAFITYCKKLCSDDELLAAYKDILVWACMVGSSDVVDNGKAVVKLSHLRRLIKVDLYKRRALVPRLSDVDFQSNAAADEAHVGHGSQPLADGEAQPTTISSGGACTIEALLEARDAADAVKSLLHTRSLQLDMACLTQSAVLLNKTIVMVMAAATSPTASHAGIVQQVHKMALAESCAAFPASYGELVTNTHNAFASSEHRDQLQTDPKYADFVAIANAGVTRTDIELMLYNLYFHTLATAGAMQCVINGSVCAVLPPVVQKSARGAADACADYRMRADTTKVVADVVGVISFATLLSSLGEDGSPRSVLDRWLEAR